MGSLVREYSKEKLTGQIFTPFFIVEKILDDIHFDSENILGKSILDPACGDGRFLIKIVERIIKYSKPENLVENLSNVYGWDIDATAIELAKEKLNHLIRPLKIIVNWNLTVENSLHKAIVKFDLFHPEKSQNQFDFIIGNPPYIRIQHLESAERQFIQKNFNFCKSGSTDIFIAFYELALNLLKPDGICGYISPNTFFQTDTAKGIRQHFESSQNLVQITNFEHLQLFDNATTYSAIVIFNKQKNEQFLFQSATNKTHFKQRLVDFSEIERQKFWQLSLIKIAQKKGKRLGDIAAIHVGITTLADKIFVMPVVKKEADYIFLQTKFNKTVKIEAGILRAIVKVSTLKSASETIKKYVIFPYKNDGNAAIIAKNELQNRFPLAYEYLLSVKQILDKRDNGRPNPVAWYAFGRTQSLNTSFGEKILFSPMNKSPNFLYHTDADATFYSGYCIKYAGNYEKLLEQLNSQRMAEYIQVTARDFRGGWKAYNKKIVQEFMIYD